SLDQSTINFFWCDLRRDRGIGPDAGAMGDEQNGEQHGDEAGDQQGGAEARASNPHRRYPSVL
ncbi:hypothetical protein, partial [Mycoplana dimorpha]|uniref:hypothetical protein n=1 Tax=Mycoplana dimorpha TaxID=28320 RepID=UPI0035BBB6A7